MKGLDGQMITARTPPERSAAAMSARGRAKRHALERQLMDHRPALLAHEIVLEVDPARL